MPITQTTRQFSQDSPGTIFDKILDGSIPAEFLHQDDQCVAFKDVSPQAPVHFLVIPRRRISMIQDVTPSDRELVGHLMVTAVNVARELGLEDGYRYRVSIGFLTTTCGYACLLIIGRSNQTKPATVGRFTYSSACLMII